jgi:uncharacterized protein (DUF736 family)
LAEILEVSMIIGRFQRDGNGYSGSIETLAFQLNPVRLVKRDKGADFAVTGPDDGELGAAWRKAGEFGDFLSIKLDCPSLLAPINAVMPLKADDDGFYPLRWRRRSERNGGGHES